MGASGTNDEELLPPLPCGRRGQLAAAARPWALFMLPLLCICLQGCGDKLPGPHGSAGCSSSNSPTPGQMSHSVGMFGGKRRTYHTYVPKAYVAGRPLPLVLSLHGWNSDGQVDQDRSGLADLADEENFLVVFPDGLADNPHIGGPWGSWNAGGSGSDVDASGRPLCRRGAAPETFCYSSCPCAKEAADWQCTWTTCSLDIGSPAASDSQGDAAGDPHGFLPALIDSLKQSLCVDITRVYATGWSNGGMAAYQLGIDFAQTFAAIAPASASLERGFNRAPQVPLPLLDIHGINDETIPSGQSMSVDGWYFTPTVEIMYTWSAVNECPNNDETRWTTTQDGVNGLRCVSIGNGCHAPLVKCTWDGGHDYFQGNHARLVWDFLIQFQRTDTKYVK